MRAFVGNYAEYSDNPLQTIRDNTLENVAETSVKNYDYTLCNIPDGRISHPLRGGRLKSLITFHCFPLLTVQGLVDASPQINSLF